MEMMQQQLTDEQIDDQAMKRVVERGSEMGTE